MTKANASAAATEFQALFHQDQPSPQVAFDSAIAAGRLSARQEDDNYAGAYMFMGRRADGALLFKHRTTRQYLPL